MTVLSLALVGVLAAEVPALSHADAQHWLTCYSRNPRPEVALAALQVMDREIQAHEGRSLAHERYAAFRTFYARVFAANPNVAAEAGAALDTLPEGQKVFVAAALRGCGTAACLKALPRAGVAEPVDDPSFSLMDAPVLDSWAAFSATGDRRYVREVIDVVRSTEVRTGADPLHSSGTAGLSLVSSASQDKRVMSILEAEMATSRDPTKSLLKGIIDAARAERTRAERTNRPLLDLECKRRPTTR
jgi:hypothetical protein